MRIKFPKIVTQKNTGQEKGRSMLEMLAVLAIIGILSIGGLAAYQYAITKYRANETIDELSKRFIDYAIAIDRDDSLVAGSPLNSDFGRITGMGYPVSATLIEPDLGLFTISLQMVPTNVCKQILRDYEGIPLQIETGTTSLGSGSKYEGDTSICNVDNNMMLFAFSPYADEWEIHDEETSATQSDTETQSETETETGTQSETETDTGTETGTETESDTGTNPCGEGRFYIDGQCLDCDYVSDPKINSSEEQNACLSCGNRTIYSNAIYGSTCALAQCPANHCRIYNGQDGTCMPIGSGLCQEESGSGTDTDTDTDTGSDTGSY